MAPPQVDLSKLAASFGGGSFGFPTQPKPITNWASQVYDPLAQESSLFNAAWTKAQTDAAKQFGGMLAPQTYSPSDLGGGGGGGGGAGGGGMSRADINRLYDMMLGTMNTNRTAANQQILAIGNELQGRLRGLAGQNSRASAALAAVLRGIYSDALAGTRSDFDAARADLARYGASPVGLDASQADMMGLLRSQGARTRSLQAEMGNIGRQGMLNAQASGQSVTAGTRQSLAAQDAAMRAQIERDRLQAMAGMAR